MGADLYNAVTGDAALDIWWNSQKTWTSLSSFLYSLFFFFFLPTSTFTFCTNWGVQHSEYLFRENSVRHYSQLSTYAPLPPSLYDSTTFERGCFEIPGGAKKVRKDEMTMGAHLVFKQFSSLVQRANSKDEVVISCLTLLFAVQCLQALRDSHTNPSTDFSKVKLINERDGLLHNSTAQLMRIFGSSFKKSSVD